MRHVRVAVIAAVLVFVGTAGHGVQCKPLHLSGRL